MERNALARVHIGRCRERFEDVLSAEQNGYLDDAMSLLMSPPGADTAARRVAVGIRALKLFPPGDPTQACLSVRMDIPSR